MNNFQSVVLSDKCIAQDCKWHIEHSDGRAWTKEELSDWTWLQLIDPHYYCIKDMVLDEEGNAIILHIYGYWYSTEYEDDMTVVFDKQ